MSRLGEILNGWVVVLGNRGLHVISIQDNSIIPKRLLGGISKGEMSIGFV